MTEAIKGFHDGQEFRIDNRYQEALDMLAELKMPLSELLNHGLPENLENFTPPALFNVVHIFHMQPFLNELEKIREKPLNVTITGVSTTESPIALREALSLKGCQVQNVFVLDVDRTILEKISALKFSDFHCLHADARKTGLETDSQDIVFNDHMGNCCPPEIDKAALKETNRILKPGGLAIINITTSDLLPLSRDRQIISQARMARQLDHNVISSLISSVYDLNALKQHFPSVDVEKLRGPILEIDPESFVVFSDDSQGHGEWFRSFESHKNHWLDLGFEIIGLKSRAGDDSHIPPLRCHRHNAILRKI